MARRRYRLLHVTTPEVAAETVVNRFVEEARANVGTWAGNYQSRIMEYVADVQRQNSAKAKLAMWYRALLSIVGAIANAFAQAKSQYYQQVQAKGVAPAVPAVVQAAQAR